MSDQPDNLVLVYLRRIDEKLDRVAADIRELNERLGLLAAQYASLLRRLDGQVTRLDRVERRLGLIEGPPL